MQPSLAQLWNRLKWLARQVWVTNNSMKQLATCFFIYVFLYLLQFCNSLTDLLYLGNLMMLFAFNSQTAEKFRMALFTVLNDPCNLFAIFISFLTHGNIFLEAFICLRNIGIFIPVMRFPIWKGCVTLAHIYGLLK